MGLVLFDTNILIDYNDKVEAALIELSRYDDAAISSITWMETCCLMSPAEISLFESSIANAGINVIHISDAIMRRATQLRYDSLQIAKTTGGKGVKLPDCIIHATAQVEGRIIVTRNARDFGGKGSIVHIPYINSKGVITLLAPLPE